MIPSLRQHFNSSYSSHKYSRFLHILGQCFGEGTPFRHAETPCFLPADLVARAADYGRELVEQLLANPDYEKASRNAIPKIYRVPNEDPVPLFVQADFGLDAEQNLKLVEIQGFPSLYGYQPVLASAYQQAYDIDPELALLPGGLSSNDYEALLSRAIVSGHDPEEVILMEIDPLRQKTRHDFVATSRLLGIAVVDPREITQLGNRLYYERYGTQIPIRRIYNRVITDELERRQIELPFDLRDELEVEWAGHPNWFFRLSKFSMPFLKHPAMPASFFLDQLPAVPDDPASYVLKPLYSFAGTGVIVGPTADDLASIPVSDRHNYILQERVNFHPCIDTPLGPTKLEIRVMYIWLDELRPVNFVLRMGRGAQMGVDFNKGLGWVGASAAFIAPEDTK